MLKECQKFFRGMFSFLSALPAGQLPPHSGHWWDERWESNSPAVKIAHRFRRSRLTHGLESIIERGS